MLSVHNRGPAFRCDLRGLDSNLGDPLADPFGRALPQWDHPCSYARDGASGSELQLLQQLQWQVMAQLQQQLMFAVLSNLLQQLLSNEQSDRGQAHPNLSVGQWNQSRALSRGAWSQSPSPVGQPSSAPSKKGTPHGLRPNAARGAQVARELGFNGVIGGIGQRKNPSDHPHGNAIDVMTQNHHTQGRQIAEHFRANHEQLGVKYVIYEQQIASPKNNWQWRPMKDRGNPTANHQDHAHVSFH